MAQLKLCPDTRRIIGGLKDRAANKTFTPTARRIQGLASCEQNALVGYWGFPTLRFAQDGHPRSCCNGAKSRSFDSPRHYVLRSG